MQENETETAVYVLIQGDFPEFRFPVSEPYDAIALPCPLFSDGTLWISLILP